MKEVLHHTDKNAGMERNQSLACEVCISSGKVSLIYPTAGSRCLWSPFLRGSLGRRRLAVQPGKMNGTRCAVALCLPPPLRRAHVDCLVMVWSWRGVL